MDYSGIEEIECEGDEVPYLSGTVKLTMIMNQERVAILENFTNGCRSFMKETMVMLIGCSST